MTHTALVSIGAALVIVYLLLGAAGFWEPLPPLVPIVLVVLY